MWKSFAYHNCIIIHCNFHIRAFESVINNTCQTRHFIYNNTFRNTTINKEKSSVSNFLLLQLSISIFSKWRTRFVCVACTCALCSQDDWKVRYICVEIHWNHEVCLTCNLCAIVCTILCWKLWIYLFCHVTHISSLKVMCDNSYLLVLIDCIYAIFT